MPSPDRHGAPVTPDHPDPDRLPSWYLEDPDMWAGLTGDMTAYLAWERATEGDGDE